MASSVPIMPGLPLVGSGLDYARDPLDFLLRAAACGDLVELRFPFVSAYLVSDPAQIERVLIADSKSYIKDRFTRDLRRMLRDGLLTSEGDLWRRQRRLANPAFHRERIAGYAAIMVDSAEAAAARLRPGETRDIHAEMSTLTMEIVSRALFSTSLGADIANVAEALAVMVDRYADPLLSLFPFLDRLPLPKGRAFWRAAERVDAILYRVIRERRAAADRGAEGAADLLGMLLAARDEDGGRMSDDELRDELMSLFVAGHETTALALTFALHLLSLHPEADAALFAELSDVLGGASPSLADIPKLRYAEAVMLEAMRLYPPAWAIGREAIAPVEVAGHRLPKGAQVWMSQWVVHRDPRWFEDPGAFRPERWLVAQSNRPRFAYFPFGGGPRLCIGQSFAMMESVLALSTIAQRWRLRRAPGHRLEMLPSITLRPKGGLPMIVDARPLEVARAKAVACPWYNRGCPPDDAPSSRSRP